MPKRNVSRGQTQQSLDREMRRRVNALLGNFKPTPEMVRASIAPLLEKLEREHEARQAREREFLRGWRKIAQARPDARRPTPAEMAAVKEVSATFEQRVKKIKVAPPKVEAVPPLVKPGSILTVNVPPYSDKFTSGPGTLSANSATGQWSINGEGFAGVCQFFVPLPGIFPVRFAPFMPISYEFFIGAISKDIPTRPARASSMGFTGAFVSRSDNWGFIKTFAIVADVRMTQWDRRVSVNDSASDSGDSVGPSPQAEFIAFGVQPVFALWAWGGVINSTSSGSGIGSGVGFAGASLAASVPFMVVEQMV